MYCRRQMVEEFPNASFTLVSNRCLNLAVQALTMPTGIAHCLLLDGWEPFRVSISHDSDPLPSIFSHTWNVNWGF